MADIYISSDHGLQWGNVTITPQELSDYIPGIDFINGLLIFDSVKIVNSSGREYITDSTGNRHLLLNLIERVLGE